MIVHVDKESRPKVLCDVTCTVLSSPLQLRLSRSRPFDFWRQALPFCCRAGLQRLACGRCLLPPGSNNAGELVGWLGETYIHVCSDEPHGRRSVGLLAASLRATDRLRPKSCIELSCSSCLGSGHICRPTGSPVLCFIHHQSP